MSSHWSRYWEGKTHGEHRYRTEDWLEKYAREQLFHITSYGAKPCEQSILVDIGCGAAELTVYYEPFFAKIYAVDSSSSMLETAQRRLDKFASKKIQLVQSDALYFAEKIDIADVIISNELAQYLTKEQISKHLNECLKVLNPKGIIIVSLIIDPDKYWLWQIGYLRESRIPLLKFIPMLLLNQVRKVYKRIMQQIPSDMGYSHRKEAIKEICTSKNLDVEFVNTLYSEYRYTALIRRMTNHRKKQHLARSR